MPCLQLADGRRVKSAVVFVSVTERITRRRLVPDLYDEGSFPLTLVGYRRSYFALDDVKCRGSLLPHLLCRGSVDYICRK